MRLGALPKLRHENAQTAATIAFHTAVALARVGAQQYPDLVASGEWGRHVGDLVARYLLRSE